ncbi:amino acid ABC transporter substrate-binding protein [Eupransor demetentiae]|uniref:Periplasmic component/domain (HisJ) n=1 Tax=Eupransor demetentiae TaxID=3109584 RepID=A0ABM9N534_9LACO|nr:ABC-type amino acid transport/signal transduction system [Lactobacillaceae bacterium LMG 33000]
MVSRKKKIVVNSLVLAVLFLGILVTWAYVNGQRHVSREDRLVKADEWDRIKTSKVITIGLDDTFVPMGFRNSKGELTGFDVDLANAVFGKMGIKVNWQPIDWSMKETELNTGNIDAIWNGYTATPDRAKQVAFSTPYHQATQVVVSLKKNNIEHFSDMKGKVLGDQTSSSGDDTLNQYPKLLKNYIKGGKPVGYDTFDKAFNDLNASRIDGLLVDEDYARYYVSHQAHPEDYQITYGDFPMSKDVVGMRKGDRGLKKAVDRGLRQMKANGQLQALEKKWFG